jgi:hypothetical protein
MTPEEFAKKMDEIANGDMGKYADEEIRHPMADDLMVKLLKELGYEKGAEIFENMNKWYA